MQPSVSVIPFNPLLAGSEAVGADAGKDKMQTRTADEAETTGGRGNVGGVERRSSGAGFKPSVVSRTIPSERNPASLQISII